MATVLAFIAQRFISFLPNESNPAELWQLISPRQHSALLNQRRTTMLVNRVRLFALLFAVLTPVWGLVDFFVFDSILFMQLGALRLLTGLSLLLLVIFYKPKGHLSNAYGAIAILFTIPALFYITAYSLLAEHAHTGATAATVSGYAFLPFLLMFGLAIFPFTLIESLVLASALLAAQMLAGFINTASLSDPALMVNFWLLILTAGVSILASSSQLTFMITLVRQAFYDPLTGVFSRGSGFEIFSMQWSSALHSEQPISVAFLDLDYFKEINDQFGHAAGDKTLRDFATQLNHNLRHADSLIRWGGEEFVIIMPATPLNKAIKAMQRIQASGFSTRPDGTPLTVSIGLAERVKDGIQNPEQLLNIADQRMYRAKKAGRNQLCSTH